MHSRCTSSRQVHRLPACEMACILRELRCVQPGQSRIKVFDSSTRGRKFRIPALSRDEAWCLHACPVDAIQLDPATGAKIVL